jgi:hypothetical protein
LRLLSQYDHPELLGARGDQAVNEDVAGTLHSASEWLASTT